MNIDLNLIPTLWYENADGTRFIPDLSKCGNDVPAGFVYRHTQFPCDLHHSILKIEDGKSSEILLGRNGWSDDLVLAMAKSGKWRLMTAILVAANSCERCMNTLAHEHGCTWGYPEYSDEWHRARTRCCFCEHEPLKLKGVSL